MMDEEAEMLKKDWFRFCFWFVAIVFCLVSWWLTIRMLEWLITR